MKLIQKEIKIRIFKKDSILMRKKHSMFSPEMFATNFIQRERNKPPLGDFALDAFSEKVIQFGYVIVRSITRILYTTV